MKTKILSLTLAIFLMLALNTPVLTSAAENSKKSQPKISYAKGLSNKDVPQYIIDDLLLENPNAENITIYGVGNTDKIIEDDLSGGITPLNVTYYTNIVTTKTVTNAKALAKDVFQFSVAKGQTVTLSQTYKASLTGSYSGSIFDSSKLGVNLTIEGTYQKSTTYSGPPESSSYNSREFRTRFYEERGNYVQRATKVTNYGQGVVINEPVSSSGTYKKPVSYANYSVDTRY